jgi:hypothetical protein
VNIVVSASEIREPEEFLGHQPQHQKIDLKRFKKILPSERAYRQSTGESIGLDHLISIVSLNQCWKEISKVRGFSADG